VDSPTLPQWRGVWMPLHWNWAGGSNWNNKEHAFEGTRVSRETINLVRRRHVQPTERARGSWHEGAEIEAHIASTAPGVWCRCLERVWKCHWMQVGDEDQYTASGAVERRKVGIVAKGILRHYGGLPRDLQQTPSTCTGSGPSRFAFDLELNEADGRDRGITSTLSWTRGVHETAGSRRAVDRASSWYAPAHQSLYRHQATGALWNKRSTRSSSAITATRAV
jgi:hypothetical protein